MQKRIGLLLVNQGSPRSPNLSHVKLYLKEVLNDPHVTDVIAPLRWLFVNAFILNFRAPQTAEAFQSIWSKDGSPLGTHSKTLVQKVSKRFLGAVEIGMRYGDNNIESAVKKLIHRGVNHIVLLPLYPQFSLSTSETAIVEFERVLKAYQGRISSEVIEDFFDHPDYIQAQASMIRSVLVEKNPDLLVLMYRGVSQRQIKKARNHKNYFDQCLRTSELLTENLSMKPETVITHWNQASNDDFFRELPRKGSKNIAVAFPSSTVDDIETLGDTRARYEQTFLKNGGESLTFVPCLNSDDGFVEAIIKIAEPLTSR
jgi:ferrochelatase